MLRNMRKGLFSGLFLILLVMGAAGLVLTDAGGFFKGGIRTSDVAKVGSKTINSRPFDNKLRRLTSMQGVEPETAYELGLVHQVLFRELRNLLMLQGANDLGIAVSNEQITSYINAIVEPYTSADTTSKKSEILAGLLRQSGMSESIFIEDVQTEMTNTILTEALKAASTHTPSLIVKDLNDFNNEQREIEYVVFKNKDAKLEQAADEETLTRYYKSFQERYRLPEKRSFTVAMLSPDKIKDSLKVTDEQALAHYEDNKASYAVPRKHKIAQGLAENEGDALKIIAAAKKGTPLSTAAKQITGDDASFIDTQAYTQGSLPKELDKDAFAEDVEKGDILGPYETALGWHVLKIVDVIEETTPSYASLEATIKQELLEESTWEALDETVGELEDRIFGGEDPKVIIADFKMSEESYKNITPQGFSDDSKESPLKDVNSEDALNILKTASTLGLGETSNVVEFSGSHLGFIIIDDIQESRIKDYEVVKSDVKKQWTKEQKDHATFMRAKALSDLINQDQISWNDAAKQVNLRAKKTSISRSPSFTDKDENKAITARNRSLLLGASLEKAQVLPGADETLLAIVKSTSLLTKPSDKGSKDDEELTALSETQNFQQEALAILYDALQQDYKIQINEKLLKFLYNQPQQQQQ